MICTACGQEERITVEAIEHRPDGSQVWGRDACGEPTVVFLPADRQVKLYNE